MPMFSSDVTSKGAIWRFIGTVAAELAPYSIYLNAVAPGPVNTHMLDGAMSLGPEVVGQDQYERVLEQKTEGGMLAEKTGELVLHLLSDRSAELYGRIVSVNCDRYWKIDDPRSVSQSDVFAMRRVVTVDGATRYPQ